ncbi:MAG TPA: hypothetical protein DEQ09_02655, partial [Bacteroidales bacterium]|nr:hypothetical protein [Bacteroidales bacterium]
MVAALFFNSCEKEGLEDNAILKSKPADFEQPIVLPLEWQCGDMLSTDLLAGKYSKAGVVEVTSDEDNLYVKYITDGWGITETHLSVTSSLEDVPGWPGNPEIGKFNYKGEHADLDEVTYTIPLSDFPGVKSFVILAHAVVKDISGCVADWYAFNALIPSTVATANYESGADGTGGSYFSIDISNDGYLNGEDYEGWCLDLNHGIKLPATSLVKFISTYDDNFAAMVGSQIDMPENIKAVNWIINQDFVGKEYAEGVVFTRGDVQTAIWRLLETTLHTHWLADEERYTYI